MVAYELLTIGYILVGFVATIDAKIPYDEIQLNIFDSRVRDFELNTIAITRNVKNHFMRDDALFALSAGLIALKDRKYVKEIGRLIQLLQRTLNDQSDTMIDSNKKFKNFSWKIEPLNIICRNIFF